jgi:DNA-binding SARP family transcriptional activator
MARTLIAKLTPPRVDQASPRVRVTDALAQALRHGLCWVAAPAGYGKTTAIAQFLQDAELPFAWYRVDEGDTDIAGFFHYLAASVPGVASPALPAFGPEYADRPHAFARRFFRAYFALWPRDGLLVLDDLHNADQPGFNATLDAMRAELPETMRCICMSRHLPPESLAGLSLRGRLGIVDEDVLRFTDDEAVALIARRGHGAMVADAADLAAVRGWAVGLMLLAHRDGRHGIARAAPDAHARPHIATWRQDVSAMHELLGREWFDTLPANEAAALLRLGLLPKIAPDIARALVGEDAPALLQRLQARQMLVTRGTGDDGAFHLHDLLRDFLRERLERSLPAPECTALRRRAAELSWAADRHEDAIELALQAPDAALATRMIVECAPMLLEQGRHQTLIDWCTRLPGDARTPWLCYWLGVAHMADDAEAECWLEHAWHGFSRTRDARGRCLAAARAVLSKTDSWRTHAGLPTWTQRAIALAADPLPPLGDDEELLVLAGVVRAFDYAEHYRSAGDDLQRITTRLLDRLSRPGAHVPPALRLVASAVLIDRAGSTGDAPTFECAVDSVADIAGRPGMAVWPLGMWLVAFGAVSGRYFHYAKRGFVHADAESALREAIAIGVREELRGVEFGALYHLQLKMKRCNDFGEWPALVERLSTIADSRHTTQVAVVADCRAALHARRGDLIAAQRECERFNHAIEAANEPPIERWPHYLTEFQVLLAARVPGEAAAFLDALVDLFDGSIRARTEVCIALARALQARDAGDEAACLARLRDAFARMREADWHDALINLPETLAALCADALAAGIEPGFCRDLIRRRRLAPPPSRPPHWPWPLKIRLLGEFGLELDGMPLVLGAKAPARSLDLLRALAIEPAHACAPELLHDRFWPDADGDRAKAACEQALHRLRKLLGASECVLLREGRLRLAMDRVWVDLDHWEVRLGSALAACRPGGDPDTDVERTLFEFPGALLASEPEAAWWRPVAERVRSKVIDLALRLASAQSVHLRGLDHYPDALRLYEALIRVRLAAGDRTGALDALARFERTVDPVGRGDATRLLRRLVGVG